jgi:ribosomal protein S18 acetylase RimI-like enzyme
MLRFHVRPFRRADRDQVTSLVNLHAAAVVPGVAASVNAVLSQFEREPDEAIVDPWVGERRALIAEQAGSVVAAALVVRHRDDADVGPSYRNAGDIRWLVFRPVAPIGNPCWRDGHAAAQALMAACLDQLGQWGVGSVHADGALPVPGVYGIPEQWPHVARLHEDSGFVAPLDGVEVVHIADLATLRVPREPAGSGVRVVRTVGINGTRLSAQRGEEEVGYIEVEVLDAAERHPRHGGLADIGNLHVAEGHRRHGIGTLLLAYAVQWLRLGHVDRLLHYATPDETAEIAFVRRHGFVELTRIRRGWTLPAR